MTPSAKGRARYGWLRAAHSWRARFGAKWCVVALLLLPAVFGSLHFGPRAAMVLALSVGFCVAAGVLPRAISGSPWRLLNPGTLITGLLLGLTLSADTPVYMIVVGALVAEIAGKQRLGILGRNLFNPAALGRASVALLELVDPPLPADLTTGASPLFKDAGGQLAPDMVDVLVGLTPGAIGETSALVLLLVAVPLLGLVVLKRDASIALILTVPALLLMLPDTAAIAGHAPWVLDPVVYVLGSATLLNAVFFATDPMTTPNTRLGGILFGCGAGALGVTGRLYTEIPGAEMWAILIMNALTPALDALAGRLTGVRAAFALTPAAPVSVASFYAAAGEAGRVETLPREYAVTLPAGWVADPTFTVLMGNHSAQAITRCVAEAGLTGCGGGHFPVAEKWAVAHAQDGPKVLIVNAQEGEPDTFKDRWLIQHLPHRVLEGAALAARALDATDIRVVLDPSFTAGVRSMDAALEDLHRAAPDIAGRFSVEVGPGLYIAGEETALIAWLEGRRAEPSPRPPHPAERGLDGRPTVIHNVETLAWLPDAVVEGAGWARAKLVCVGGCVQRPGLYTHALSTSLRAVVDVAGGCCDGETIGALAIGGPTGALLPPSLLNISLLRKALSGAGAPLGTGTIRVVGGDVCLLAEAVRMTGFAAATSCGRCTPCRAGAPALQSACEALCRGEDAVDRVVDLSGALELGSTCGLGMAAPGPIRSVLRYWPGLVRTHHRKECVTCRSS